jgi:hypothetical protein
MGQLPGRSTAPGRNNELWGKLFVRAAAQQQARQQDAGKEKESSGLVQETHSLEI